MPETSDTTINIGGRIKRSDLPKLWAAIEEAGVFDFNGAFNETVSEENYDPIPGDTLLFNDPDCSWGRFEGLEGVLVKLGLPFERYNDDGLRVVFTGAGEPQDVPADSDGSAVIDAKKATELGSMEAIAAYLEAANFSPPPFEIVDDDPLPQDAQPIDYSMVPQRITADEMISCLAGALQACEHQIEQMAGMFPDEDGTIKAALEAGEHAWAALEAYRTGEPMPDPGSDDDDDEDFLAEERLPDEPCGRCGLYECETDCPGEDYEV